MAVRMMPRHPRHQSRFPGPSSQDGLRMLMDDGPSAPVLLPQRHNEGSDSDDYLDVAQQLQQAEVKERLRNVIESNRGARGRRPGNSSRGQRETVAYLRQATAKWDSKFSSLSCVSEGSSEVPHPESTQQQFQSAAREMQSEVGSSAGAPASFEDDLSGFLEDSSHQLSAPSQSNAQQDRALTMSSEDFATKEELSSVLACLRRVERKVDWLMSQERKVKAPDLTAMSIHPGSALQHLYEILWVPTKVSLQKIWPGRLILPILELVETFACYFLS